MPFKRPVEALRHVSLEVQDGEIFGLIGKNGAGKTTLTKIIATLVQPTSGSVEVKGFDSVKNEVKVRSMIGLATAEERSFYWRLTSRQNMLFFSRLYGMKDRDARRRIDELFEQLDLAKYEKRRFSELSTGNKQRLAVARALLAKPPVLLLDEPTRSLDPVAAASMRNLIASLEGVSILLTSHNLSEIEELCDRIAVISNGEIRASDTPENLRSSHKQTQRVRISLKNGLPESLQTLNNLRDFQLEQNGELLTLEFTREADDGTLGETIADIAGRNINILDVETEKTTLLEVLESYE
ncbi:MAG: ABC transporter ATP-binding protein [Pyrinomonadaceae bacterium]|nr:ABC transporter ATP-binding protein [Pyrinomonadaceae bacterium]